MATRPTRILRLIRKALTHPRAFVRGGFAAVDRRNFDFGELHVIDPEYQEPYSRTIAEWMGRHHREIVFSHVNWMGVETLKMVLDLWIYQEILAAKRPELLIEIGSFRGGSTLFFAHLFDILGSGQVVSIDIDRSKYEVSHPRITELTGDNLSDAVFARARELAAGRRTMIVHDGDHRYENVLGSLRLYGDLVTPGQYFVVEDGVMDVFDPLHPLGYGGKGPLGAIRDFVRESSAFEIDRSRERYGITYNPNGYLLRK
jgi:cephalosporin hydroxylase